MDILEESGSYQVFSESAVGQTSPLDWSYLCAMNLLKYPLDNAISEHLSYIGAAADADRAWLIEYDADLLRFSNTHEWCRSGTQPFISELQATPTTMIAWLHKYMKNNQAVMIKDTKMLPRTAHKIQVEFIRQGVKSVLSVPLFFEGKLRGLYGFDATTENRSWSRDEINALFKCANLIAQARYSVNQNSKTEKASTDSEPLVYLSKRGVVRGVLPERIVGVRSAGNYSEIWLDDGSALLDSRSLGVWMSILSANIFMRIHRTAFINMLHVTDIDRRKSDKWQIQLRHIVQPWPVSRAYRRHLRERMGI